ncbi:MAG: hypothetical protein HQL27_07255 [Candidatus Omnitrophica bacterium]|nr:hypothetical protein [Candidatus Omnitrophota bacterium]
MAEEIQEIGKNCAGCKKPLKKARKYYRNGKYFCNNTCFNKLQETVKKQAEQKAQA